MVDIISMTSEHLNQVVGVENECFDIPWSKSSFEKELKNKFAIYFVAINSENGDVIGYCGLWHVINEGHITNIAVKSEYRRNGIATRFIEKLIEVAEEKEMIGLTLEVRTSNQNAIDLYKKMGFKMEGIRKEYYSDTKEDALIMWKYLIPEEDII